MPSLERLIENIDVDKVKLWSGTGSSLICKEGCSRAGFPWGGAWGSLTAHSPLQSATLLSQHYHYLRWPNLHVRRSVTLNIIFCL
jgi:hypothetical protein